MRLLALCEDRVERLCQLLLMHLTKGRGLLGTGCQTALVKSSLASHVQMG